MSGRFEVHATPLDGLVVLERKPMGDARGSLTRMFCARELARFLGGSSVVQANFTRTALRGTVRGLHLQSPPFGEDKLVSCMRGKVWDVAVDVREGSPTFLKWHAEVLDGDGHRSMLVPKGFAHGFQALTDDCELLYFCTAAHEPSAELGLDALDPDLGIAWPETVSLRSARDMAHPPVRQGFRGVRA
jgi:dTDP-4-dehydrorhamnose 3,5-epimerase